MFTRLQGRPDLPIGTYILEENRQAPPHDRKIKDAVRAFVLARDGYACTYGGWTRSQANRDDPRRQLELHHLTAHVDKGTNNADNLITLCNVDHDRVHAGEIEWQSVGARWTIEPVRPNSASMDHLSPEERSANMARIKGADTRPELAVRRALHALGYRFRLHRRDLPGSPDIVLPRLKTVIFVHGCYWHRHQGCRRASVPSTRREFWRAKFARTVIRDQEQRDRLVESGWNVLTIWECETRDRVAMIALIKAQLPETCLAESSTR